MRLLFEMNSGDYNPDGTAFVRPSVRSIIIRDNKVAMVHSLKYNYYKFPGGGLEAGEGHAEALIRETAEEAGLAVIAQTISEYGYVHRVQKGATADMFIQDNYYYFCEAQPEMLPQSLDDYESEERFTPEWVSARAAIDINRNQNHGPKDPNMTEREAGVLELLIAEGYLTDE